MSPRNDLSLAELVDRATGGDRIAWDELVDRFAPLVWSVCQRFGMRREDIEETGQNVWLILVENLGKLREPAALPGWLATTTRRECLRVLRGRRLREQRELHSDEEIGATSDDTDVESWLLAEERDDALREGFRQLPARCQQLLEMLMADPRPPYAEIGRRLDMPIGAIGPNRARCLDKLRRSPAFAEWLAEHPEEPGVRCPE
jgi:RNA polymerase sigma factor (sigma-70 family)